MFDVGLRGDALGYYLRRLNSHHTRNWRVQVLDLEHNVLDNITPQVLDGEVTINLDGEHASRACDLALFDPNDDLGFLEPDNGSTNIWFLSLMIQVHSEVYVPELGRWIECAQFTGPVVDFKRKEGIVTLGCAGKDYLAKKSWPRITLPRGMEAVEAIRSVLASFGEDRFRFTPQPGRTLGYERVMERAGELSPWGWCRQMAAQIGMRLFYDGEGTAVLKFRNDTDPVAIFADDDGGNVMTVPETSSDYSRLLNVARVEGIAEGTGKAPGGEWMVDQSSPIHPEKLIRNGKPMYLGEVVVRDTVKTNAQGRSAARDLIRDRQYLASTTTFDALPLLPLEEYDPFLVTVDDYAAIRIVSKLTIAFDPNELMPVGYSRTVSPTLANLRSL